MDTNTEPTPAYQVRLEVFEGPLDLLLHLIEKQELDITRVSVLAVIDQYLDYIRDPACLSASNLADFLVLAAKLLLIKSRALLPAAPTAETGEPEEDLGEELAQQLRDYKRFREVANELREREKLGLRAYLREAAIPQLERQLDVSGISLEDLLTAVQTALAARPELTPVGEVAEGPTFSITHKMAELEACLGQRGTCVFQHLLHLAVSRLEIIVTFLALLELIKARKVRAEQDRPFGEIVLLAGEEPPSEPGLQ